MGRMVLRSNIGLNYGVKSYMAPVVPKGSCGFSRLADVEQQTLQLGIRQIHNYHVHQRYIY